MKVAFKFQLILGLAMALAMTTVGAGPLDPDCTPEKAAKHAAEKATVGVGNRCDPKETASDSAKKAAGVDDKKAKDKKDDMKDGKNNNGWSTSK
jgi:hypothetical protein